jgi:hypothetical protein
MSTQPKKQKMSAGDILASETHPYASTVSGQHLRLSGKTAIDPTAQAQVVQAGQSIRVPSGTTLCIFQGGCENDLLTVKIHATEELTLTGPMVWAEMPTADVEKVLEERSRRGLPSMRDFSYFELASMVCISAIICHIFPAPADLFNEMLQDSENGLFVTIMWALLSLFLGAVVFSIGFKLVARLMKFQGEYITMGFSRYLMVVPPNIEALR